MSKADGGSQNGSSGGTANQSSDFVRKLYKMLEDPSYSEIVRWGDDMDSFVVLENEKFTKSILPKHFKHSNFASFVRQLNKYDFHKVRQNNEENGSSQYGSGAWEFKHPDFKANNKDALDNIRRKAPAPRKTNTVVEENLPTQQMDLVSNQLAATQAQLRLLEDRYSDLSMHYSMLVQEVIGVQKTVVNHEQIMANVLNFLYQVDSRHRRESRIGFPNGQDSSANNDGSPEGTMGPLDDLPATPLANASKILQEMAENQLNLKNLEQMSEMHNRAMNSTTPPPDKKRTGAPGPGSTSSSTGQAANSYKTTGDLDSLVYPVGTTVGIDPMYSEHIHNIPYAMPDKEQQADPRPNYSESQTRSVARSHIDMGWVRAPQILLVEDDQACRRIGSKFLYSFQCAIDSAFDGLEAVNKMNAGSKYDLVLMDIIMPNLDGVSACHLIRQFDTTPIIAMTSNIRADDIAMYFQHGMNDVLPKPFTRDGLLQMLDKHLAHLKKPETFDMMPTSASTLTHTSMNQSLKDESSPGTSPAASGQFGASTYSVDHNMQYTSPTTAGPGNRGMAHRRQVSEMSGADDAGNDQKRQRVYTNQSMGQLRRQN